jgi:hypothetical protein
MRWILIALVLTTEMYAQTVGSSNLYVWEFEDCQVITSGNNAPKLIKKNERMLVLAKVLSEYTSKDDAIRTAKRYCTKSDDPELWTAMTLVESSANSNAVSPVGAQGKLQVMPSWKNKKGFEFYRGRYSHLNDDLNFKAAQKILTDNLNNADGKKWVAVERYCGTGPAARAYVAKVQRIYYSLKKATKHCLT